MMASDKEYIQRCILFLCLSQRRRRRAKKFENEKLQHLLAQDSAQTEELFASN